MEAFWPPGAGACNDVRTAGACDDTRLVFVPIVTARGGERGWTSWLHGQAASIKQMILWADFLTAQFPGQGSVFHHLGRDPLRFVDQALARNYYLCAISQLRRHTEGSTLAAEVRCFATSRPTRTGRVSIESIGHHELAEPQNYRKDNLDHHLRLRVRSTSACKSNELMSLTVLCHRRAQGVP